MIQILITSFLVLCFSFCFIIYCALANKKPTPSPGQKYDVIPPAGQKYKVSTSGHNHVVDPLTCPVYLGTTR